MAEEIKQSVRIQTSLLNGVEHKFLVWMAPRLPHWVTSDMLTAFGVLGSFVVFLGYVIAGLTGEYNWLWLSSFGLLMNWYGDSLDGTLARVRGTQRKLYGYYLDHNIDCVTEFFMFVGFGLSGLCHLWLALMAFVFYLQLEVYVAINAKIKNEFRLTYGIFGPTEFRAIIALCNVALTYIPAFHTGAKTYSCCGISFDFQLMDWLGVGIVLILMVIYLTSFFQDLRYFDKLDPLPQRDADKR